MLLCAIPQFAEPALADSTYTVGDKTFSYTELEKQPDGTQKDSITGPDGERGVIVKNNDGTVLLATDSEKHLIAGENCSDDRDDITDFKEITVRECRKDSSGEASWHKTVYLEYTCKKPPYYTRRIPLSVTEELTSENKPVPCTEEEFQSSGRAAAQFGATWDGVKAPPPGETPPPQQPPGQGGGGGKGDVPPGANKYDCLSDDAKRSLRLTQDLLVGAWLDWQRAFAQLPSIVQRAAATADAHKVVKAKLDAAAKSGDVEATDKANRELWNASNTLGSAKKDLEKLKDYLKWAQDRIAAYKKAVDYYSSLPPCPEEKKTTETGGGGGGEFKKETGKTRRYEPRFVHPFGETISRVVTGTDSEKWCTYGDGVQFETALVATDESGAPIDVSKETEGALEEVESVLTALNEEGGHPDGKPAEPSGVPAEEMPLPQPTEPATPSGPAPETSKAPETPTTTEQPPPPTTPEMPTTTPEMPTTTEKPPEEPASPIPDTIFVKAKESVLEGQPTGSPIENQVVKLFPPEEPQLPGEGGSKEAQDTGFDKDPVECTTGADGNCQMHVATEDRALYGMPSTGANPGKTYRIDYDLPQTSGGVAETTGRPAEPDVTSGTPGGAKVTRQVFRIGERTFIRLVYEQPHGLDHNFEEQFKPIFGENYEEDDCRDKQPGPPLGMEPRSYSSLDRELPESIVKLASGTMRRAARTAPPLPAHSNERTPPAGALAHRQLSN